MEENNDVNVQELKTVDGVFIDDTIETLEIPNIENPDDREYENIEMEQEEGL